ncbi:MAG: O-antigen ligase family protein, partial [Flammeovirgaceae bacterium]
IYWFVFLIFCFTIPFSQVFSSKLLIGLAALGLFFLSKQALADIFKRSWDVYVFYVVLVVGLIFTENAHQGFRLLETDLCLIALPFVLSVCPVYSKRELDQIFFVFISGLLLACIICLAHGLVACSKLLNPSWRVLTYETLTSAIAVQPTYFAYYLVFAITILLYKFYFEMHRRHLAVVASLILFFFLVLLLTGSQTVFISLLFVFSFFIAKYLVQRTSKRESLAMLFVIAAIAVLGIWTTQAPLQESSHHHTDYWERFDLWKAAIHANDNIWTGVGTGDYEDALNQYYRSHQMAHFADSNLNAHNQYLQLMLSNGILGLLAFLVMMVRPLYLATTAKDLIGVLLLYPFLLYGITEVFLGRYQGVVFFGLVHQTLVAYYAALPSSELAKLNNLRAPNADVNI